MPEPGNRKQPRQSGDSKTSERYARTIPPVEPNTSTGNSFSGRSNAGNVPTATVDFLFSLVG